MWEKISLIASVSTGSLNTAIYQSIQAPHTNMQYKTAQGEKVSHATIICNISHATSEFHATIKPRWYKRDASYIKCIK